MKEILDIIIQGIVDDKEAVKINEIVTEGEIVFEVTVAEGDRARAIGRQGRVVKSIGDVLNALARRERKIVKIRYVD